MFTRGNILKIFGLLLILLLLLFAQDYWPWLENPRHMFLAMAVPVSALAAWEVFKRARDTQANNQLSAAVLNQAKADQRPSGDVVQLRERFEEAIATLKQQKKRGGLGLYELPWYVIIGAPGSGKTTALKYSGLKFPLEQRSGRGALRGVGGTRNCDWWFTEEAVLLDTAGRYTTQDSDAAADSAGWSEFLALLKKHRKRRPLNGVLLAISAQDLMTQGHAGREAHVAAARRRLNELNKELRVQLPVYVLVTKCDLIAGFSEYFEDMSQQDRAQVLGVTFAKDVTMKGAAADAFPAEFDAVVQRLNERVYARLESEHDSRRRASMFSFPQQLASLREGLSEFIGEIFESTRFDQRVLLRGVYFTSGTQEGTPIDRLLGALGRRLSVPADAVASGARAKSYFIEKLMKDVILAESGLAGVSRRMELQKALAQFGLYVGLLGAGALLVLLLSYSYRTNSGFLAEFEARTKEFAATIPAPGSTVLEARPRLDHIRALLDEVGAWQRTHWWSSYGWGLAQTGAVEEAISNFYRGELKNVLVKTVKTRLAQRLETLVRTEGRDSLDLYLTLRAYLMLKGTGAEYFDPNVVQAKATDEWREMCRHVPACTESLDRHFAWLLSQPFPESDLDGTLVAQARQAIPTDATPAMILALVKSNYEKSRQEDGQPPPRVIQTDAFRTRGGGRDLGANLSIFYTRDGFEHVKSGELIQETERQFREEKWFWADRTPPEPKSTRSAVWQRYAEDYIKAWDDVLNDIGVPQSGIGPYIQGLVGAQQGLKPLLVTVDRHTSLVPAVYEVPPASFSSSPWDWIRFQSSRLSQAAKGQTTDPGAVITDHFSWVHWMVTPVDGKVLIDKIIETLKPVGDGAAAAKSGAVGGSAGGESAVNVGRAAQAFQQETKGMPGSVGAVLAEMVGAAVSEASAGTSSEVERIYGNFAAACQEVVRGRGFIKGSNNDVTPDDLKRLLGSEFDKLLNDLKPYMEERGGRYASLTLPNGAAATPANIVAKVNEIDGIRKALMPAGDLRFRVDIRITERLGRTTTVEIPSEALFEGKKLRPFRGDAPQTLTAAWPVSGDIAVTFFDGDRTESIRGTGHWNLFDMLAQAKSLTKQSETVYVARFQTQDGQGAEIRLEAKSALNPLTLFKTGVLHQFTCGR